LRARLREVAVVHHPTLARLVAVGDEDGRVMVAREWIEGEVMSTSLGAGAAADALIAVLDGIEMAHWHDLCHGRIAPDRIVLSASGPVLVDLGLEGQGSVQGDLRAVADTLEAVGAPLPDPLAQVVAATHQGMYPTARDLQDALRKARRGVAVPVPALWARGALVAALGLLIGVGVVWWRKPEPVEVLPAPPPVAPVAPAAAPAPPPPAPAPAPEPRPAPSVRPPSPTPAPASPPPAPEPEVVVLEVPAPTPAPAPTVRISTVPAPAPVPVPVPVPAPPPAPVPAPVSTPVPRGAWELEAGAGDTVILRIAAEQSVVTRTGASGRPVLEVHCRRGKADVYLLPGVAAVETVVLENGSMAKLSTVRATVPGQASREVLWKGSDGASTLALPRRDLSWFRGLERVEGVVALAYTPFASDAVLAGFRWTGFADAAAPYRSVCGFD